MGSVGFCTIVHFVRLNVHKYSIMRTSKTQEVSKGMELPKGSGGTQSPTTKAAHKRGERISLNSSPVGGMDSRSIKTLDWVHTIFLLYSGAHNTVNAWHRAENFLFFVFVVVGILSVELMLWTTYKNWKNGRFVGKMIRIGKYATIMAMFYATAGILAQAQAGGAGDWINTYYNWILPSSAPMMFIFAFWIQTADPIMTAQRDAIAYAHMIEVETTRGDLDQQKLELDYKRDMRRLKAHVHRQKMFALMKESVSRRSRTIIKRAMQIQMPRLLKQAGVDVDSVTLANRGFLGSFRRPKLTAGTNGQLPKVDKPKTNGSSKTSLT